MPIDCASTPLVLAAKSPSPSAARYLNHALFCPWPSCAASVPAPPAFPVRHQQTFAISLRSSSASFSEASWLESCCSSPAGAPAAVAVYRAVASRYRLLSGLPAASSANSAGGIQQIVDQLLFHFAQLLAVGFAGQTSAAPFPPSAAGWRVQAIRRSCSISRPAWHWVLNN